MKTILLFFSGTLAFAIVIVLIVVGVVGGYQGNNDECDYCYDEITVTDVYQYNGTRWCNVDYYWRAPFDAGVVHGAAIENCIYEIEEIIEERLFAPFVDDPRIENP